MSNTYEYNGITIMLDGQATLADDGERYVASGRDNQGNRYDITWDCTAAWIYAQAAYKLAYDAKIGLNIKIAQFVDDESNACDWDVYTVRQVG